MTKIIVVFGATGGQGGSVITTYLDEIGWKVRGVTRNASSTQAEALKARGVEVFQADLNDSISLADAIEGAQAIFGVTDYWGLFRNIAAQQDAMGTHAIDELAKEAEAQQLKNLIDAAAKSPILERFIISSLPNIIKLSHGKYPNVYPYNGKAEAVDYIEENYPALWSKTSVYRPGYFLVNFIDQPMGQPQKVSL
jgi:NADP-dependent 3-hydroxy acid dehydrogenase YdfG